MAVIKLVAVLTALLSVAAAATPSAGVSPRNGMPLPDLFYATIDDLQWGMGNGTFTAVDLVNAYLGRIAETNPFLHAIIETNPDAVSIAAGLDAERANGTVRGPLHGIPIMVKDNVGTFDKMNTTAGSFSLLGAKLPRDATIAAKLKAAGGIILGKANLSQWANYRSTNTTNGWTARGGQTSAAYYPLLDPSGSSSGPGVASSIGLAAVSIGTETSGSIISPGSRNSLAAIKPSVGLTSRYNIIPISQTQDTPGPMTRTMKDSAYVLAVIAGMDQYDNYTSAIPFTTTPDYVSMCTGSDGLKGAKIGIPRNAFSASATNGPELAAFNASIAIFKSLGAIIQDPANFPDLAGYRNFSGAGYATDPVVGADFVYDIANYFNGLTYNPNNITNINELINFTMHYPAEDYPDRNVVTWQQDANLTVKLGDAAYYAGLEAQDYFGSNATILGAIEQNGLDALILPSSSSPGYASIAGYPIITVPLGYYPPTTNVTWNSRGTLVSLAPNTPFGLSFYSRRFDEATIIKFACAYEAATNHRNESSPFFKPNVQLITVM